MKKKVSVIMPCYNEKLDWIKLSIESILNQTYSNIEVIIISDNPDNFKLNKLINFYSQNDKRIKIIFNKSNLGIVKSLNSGLKIATGEYIARMDADDISHLNRIEKQVDFLEKNKHIDLVMCYANSINENGEKIGEKNLAPITMRRIKEILKARNISIHPTWMFRNNILTTLQGYKDIDYVEDYDFLCRCIIQGYKIETIPEILLDYRIRNNSICNENRLIQQYNFQVVNKNYKKAIKKYENSFEFSLDNMHSENLSQLERNINKANNLIKSNKYIKGYILLFIFYICSDLKRRQLINEIYYKIYLLKGKY